MLLHWCGCFQYHILGPDVTLTPESNQVISRGRIFGIFRRDFKFQKISRSCRHPAMTTYPLTDCDWLTENGTHIPRQKTKHWNIVNWQVKPEAVLAIRPGRPWPIRTRAWPTQTNFCPMYTTPVGLPKICMALWLTGLPKWKLPEPTLGKNWRNPVSLSDCRSGSEIKTPSALSTGH